MLVQFRPRQAIAARAPVWGGRAKNRPEEVPFLRVTHRTPPRDQGAVDLRGHYSNLPMSSLRAPLPSPEWCQQVHDLHERFVEGLC